MSKSKAFLIGMGVICLFGVIVFVNPDYPAGQFLTAAVALTTGYFSLQVVNNGVIGKFFNHELYHHEKGEIPDNFGGQK